MTADRGGALRRSVRLLALAAALLLASAVPPPRVHGLSAARLVSRQVYLMGTEVVLSTHDADRARGLGRLESFLRSLERTEAELSTWRSDSVLGRLNRQPQGVPFGLDARTCRLFGELYFWHRETDGAFDPAVGPFVDAWDLHGAGRRPSVAELQQALERSGLRRLELRSGACDIVRRQDATIDSGGFGKGEALDRVLALVAETGDPAPWMIDLGGQVMVFGRPPDAGAWTVAIAHPIERQRRALGLRLTSGSLSVSGGSERDVTVAGHRIGHILDPRTGAPVVSTGAVAVWHERGLAADILSTALYVMGPENGWRWADAREIAACYLQAPGGAGVHIRATRAFRERFPDATIDGAGS